MTLHEHGADALTAGVFPTNDSGNCDRLLTIFGADLRHCPTGWLRWDGRRWIASGGPYLEAEDCARLIIRDGQKMGGEVGEALAKWGRTSGNAQRIAACVSVAQHRPTVRVELEQLDADPYALNCLSGIVDLRTGLVRPHDRAALCTKLAPVAYDERAHCPRFIQFLHECMDGDMEMVGYLLRFAGYCLTGVCAEQVFGLWSGVGANGKSTMLELLQYVMGDYAVTLDAGILLATTNEQHPTGLMDLRGARLATAVEPDSGRKWNESLLKMLVGGDKVSARRMRADYVSFRPSHKLVISCNAKPLVRDQGRGFWRRLHAATWGVSFEARKDIHLRAKLEAEAPGILAMLVLGCRDWLAQGLSPPTCMLDAAGEYQRGQDTVGAFLAECVEEAPDRLTPKAALYRAYKEWAIEGGEYVHGKQAFNRILVERGWATVKPRGQGECWGGRALRTISPLAAVR